MDRFLRTVAVAGLALLLITELLSAFNALSRIPVAIAWAALLAAGVRFASMPRVRRAPIDPVLALACTGAAAILAATLLTALASPPNSADAMAYHMPRVIYWAEQHSVRFFPTPYLNHIMLQPFAEYAMLHLYLLSGGDRLTNLVQWFASVVTIIGVAGVTRRFGFTLRAQALSALFCATIPAGVLASSGAKNDYVLAMWLVLAIYFALTAETEGDAVFLGIAAGCALLTKGTAYLFAPWLLVAALGRKWRVALIALACALAINVPHYARNINLSGSPLGFDSAHGDGFFRWRNDTFGWKPTVSNMLRNASEQLGARSESWNRGVYDAVVWMHQRLGIDAGDPATTWPWTGFTPPKNANHEADAPNRRHLALLAAAACLLAFARFRRHGPYILALAAGFVSFCAYLKWQQFMARLFLPLYLAGAPLAGIAGGRFPALAQVALCLFLLDTARLPALENWTRPLRGPRSVLHTPRDVQYFADLHPWNNEGSYREAARVLAESGCATIGIDATHNQLEYPLIALIRERVPSANFLHTGAGNASARYRQPVAAPPCAIACLDCAGDTARLGNYGEFPQSVPAGKFVLLLR